MANLWPTAWGRAVGAWYKKSSHASNTVPLDIHHHAIHSSKDFFERPTLYICTIHFIRVPFILQRSGISRWLPNMVVALFQDPLLVLRISTPLSASNEYSVYEIRAGGLPRARRLGLHNLRPTRAREYGPIIQISHHCHSMVYVMTRALTWERTLVWSICLMIVSNYIPPLVILLIFYSWVLYPGEADRSWIQRMVHKHM